MTPPGLRFRVRPVRETITSVPQPRSTAAAARVTSGIAAPLGVLAGVAAAFAYVGTVDPNAPGHYPVCPLLHFTGLYCPGCGGLRSAYAVVHGEFGTALGLNALAVAGYGLFAVLWTVWLVRAARGRPFTVRLRPAHWWAVGAVVLAFAVVRNLPFGAALAP
ncbi:MAG: rane protein [Streptomyces oryziradicis]|nr:rane protein [Actinacidiphila oryziradicis]